MKNYNHQIATKLGSRFKNIFILVSVLVISHSHGNAQITKTFTKEIEVDENITLESNVPSSMDLHIHGTMSSSNTKNSYSIAGKNNDVRLNISKELEIKTWDQNIVRQETVVSVKAETEQKAQDFLDELELNLRMGADHRVVIDCNLNMELFKMKNGFFKSDDCTITLENGRTFSLEYLALETKLSIPKYSNLQLTGHQHCTVRLGELEGDLGLELKYAEVYASNVRNLRASLRSCYTVIFNEVETANISSSNSYVEIAKAEAVKIGTQSLNDACDLPHIKHRRSNSAQTKYRLGVINSLYTNDSTNDEISVHEVHDIYVTNTSYTDFNINKLSNVLSLEAISSGLLISNISKEFSKIDINNSLGNINLYMETDAHYLLSLAPDNYIEGLSGLSNLKREENGREIYQVGAQGKGGTILLNCDRCKFDIQ